MARILVVGSVARDEVVRVEGILRPGTHGKGVTLGARLGGGAATFALPLATLGHSVALVSPIGKDTLGDQLLQELAAAGVDIGPVRRVDGPSTHSLVLVDEAGERTILNLRRCQEATPPSRLRGLQGDCLYVRSRSLDLAPLLAEQTGTALVVAHVPPCEPLSRPAHVLVGSEADLPAEWLEAPWRAGLSVAGAPLRWVVVTRGPAGASAHGADRELRAPAPEVEVVDTTGAGDAFAAGLVHALVSGAEMEQALVSAVAFGTESTRWQASALPREALDGAIIREQAVAQPPPGDS